MSSRRFSPAMLVLLFSFARPGTGSVLVVTNTTDVVNGNVSSPAALQANPGPDGISLREAVLATNNAVGPHTITFSPSLAGQTIAINAPLRLTRDGVTLQGVAGADGPAVTLDGKAITSDLCCRAILFANASGITVSRLRITGTTSRGIWVQAGDFLYQPGIPQRVANIRIDNNVFENNGLAADGAINIAMDPEGTASGASITDVQVTRNVFRGFDGIGVIVQAAGTDSSIQDVLIQSNTFLENRVGSIEISANAGTNNGVSRARILGNAIVNGNNPILLFHLSETKVPTSGAFIEDTLIAGNTLIGDGGSVSIFGGQANTVSAVGNVIRNTQIVNNALLAGAGIRVIGGKTTGATRNRVEGVSMVNNTLVTSTPGLTVTSNSEGGSGNTVTGVAVSNSIFWPRPEAPLGAGFLVGELAVSQVDHSITPMPDFTGANGNLSANPLLANAANGDLHLRPGSPAIDAGTSDGAPSRDLEGRPRFDDPATPNTGGGSVPYYDIGAYEYASVPVYRLTVATVGTGNGTVTASPSGINCGSECSALYYAGTAVKLTPVPATGSVFGGWVGDRSCGTVTVTADKTCTARFVPARSPRVVSPRR